MDRRSVLGLGAVALAGFSARASAEAMNAAGVLSSDPSEVVPLWPGTPPGGDGVNLTTSITERSKTLDVFHDRFATAIAAPQMTVFRPQNPDGSAVLIAPGGGYQRVVIDKEGFEAARRLNGSGVTAFVLRYRLPGDGWANRADVPLQDAQRAMRLIRAGAQRFNIDPVRTGILGFSAGGHVAASLATRHADAVYTPVDADDAVDAKPSFAGLMYPVITMGDGGHATSRLKLLGPDPSAERIAAYSCDTRVGRDTPPSFVVFAADDKEVPPFENGMAMFDALRKAKVPAELHVFQDGGHGFGIRLAAGKPASVWPDLFLHWGYSNGWFRNPSTVP